jgi:hypothetical protein
MLYQKAIFSSGAQVFHFIQGVARKFSILFRSGANICGVYSGMALMCAMIFRYGANVRYFVQVWH